MTVEATMYSRRLEANSAIGAQGIGLATTIPERSRVGVRYYVPLSLGKRTIRKASL